MYAPHEHAQHPCHRVLSVACPGPLTKPRSFPRKRESSPWTAHFQRFAEWIPAFAGITAGWSARVSQMTPIPCALRALAPTLPFSRMGCREAKGQFSSSLDRLIWCFTEAFEINTSAAGVMRSSGRATAHSETMLTAVRGLTPTATHIEPLSGFRRTSRNCELSTVDFSEPNRIGFHRCPMRTPRLGLSPRFPTSKGRPPARTLKGSPTTR